MNKNFLKKEGKIHVNTKIILLKYQRSIYYIYKIKGYRQTEYEIKYLQSRLLTSIWKTITI